MKTFKITKINNEVNPTKKIELTPDNQIVTSGRDLCLVIEKTKAIDITVGSRLVFKKFAYGNNPDSPLKVCEEETIVTKIEDVLNDGEEIRYVYFNYLYIKPLTIASFNNISVSSSPYKYKLYFTSDHYMLAEDLIKQGNYEIYARRGDKVVRMTGLAFCYPGELVKGENSDEGGNCTTPQSKRFNYETMERNSILVTNMTGLFTPETGDQVLFCTNPYFFTRNGQIILYDNVEIHKYTGFMDLGVTLAQDYDAKRLYQEQQVNEQFVDKIKESVIPGFIDLEKIKYAPAFSKETEEEGQTTITTLLATGITFNPHFRTRVRKSKDSFEFEDVWHVKEITEEDEENTWNGRDIEDTGLTRQHLYDDNRTDFINSANLIGFLGFTDDDIYNQKNKVKKTFLRLSFYDSKDMLEQNLLYYSTIFLDSGDLFGKFVKRKAWLEDSAKKTKYSKPYDPEKEPVVWSPASETDPCCAVTCQFIVNDEYDTSRSGEGFNLYLFRQDAPPKNGYQDIYMKVEFNHAGYGRTVPLIFWKKNKQAQPEKLTIENYIENLYITVRISFTEEKGYVYSFPDAVSAEEDDGENNGIVWKDERLIFNLFEPTLER